MDDAGRGEVLREGLRLAIVGPPNAGKSSLINALARRDIAIVSDIPGTTRDVIGVRLDLGGYPVHVADTAGLRDTKDAIEAEGVRRARAEAAASHLTLLLLDGRDAQMPAINADLIVRNKSDLPDFQKTDALSLSLKTGEGMPQLLQALTALVAAKLETQSDAPALTRPRHRHALMEALQSLQHAQTAAQPELFAEDLRLAMRAIGRITGSVDVEEILDSVFRDFCIGK
jgi:tRNA modification GTPase